MLLQQFEEKTVLSTGNIKCYKHLMFAKPKKSCVGEAWVCFMQLSVIHLVTEIHFYSIKLEALILCLLHIFCYILLRTAMLFQNTELFKGCCKAFQTEILSRSPDTFWCIIWRIMRSYAVTLPDLTAVT